MKKNITIIFSILSGITVTILFITSTSYIQLAIASLLYPPIAYLIFKGFSMEANNTPAPKIALNTVNPAGTVQLNTSANPPVEVIDFDKRAFLKLVGATGLSFFVFSFLSKKFESSFFQKTNTTDNNVVEKSSSATDGYKVNEIDNGEISYYGFVNENDQWYIMRENSVDGSFRYAKGKSEFAKNWANRESFDYGYYHNVFGN